MKHNSYLVYKQMLYKFLGSKRMNMVLKIFLLIFSFFTFSFCYGQLFIKVHYNLVLTDSKGEVLDIQKPIQLQGICKLIAQTTEESLDEDMQKVSYEIIRAEISQYRGGGLLNKKKISSNQINFQEFAVEKSDKLTIKITGLKRTNLKGATQEIKMEDISPKDLKMFVMKLTWGE